MPLTNLPEAFLQTFIHQIALLLLNGAGGDMEAALHAAKATIASYNPRNETELRLAARIISFSLQSGEALAQAADPQMPLTRVLRLRTGAVSLAREAEKAERRLEKRREAPIDEPAAAPEPVAEPEPPRVEKTTALIADNRKVAAYAKAHGLTWTQAYNQRNRELRLAERQRKQQARANAA
jgi:hypothetical protein